MTVFPTKEELGALLRDLRPFLLDPTLAGDVTVKNRNDFVTAADFGVQERLSRVLKERYSDFRFMGEEGEDHSVSAEIPTFVLDPIDGTTNYIFSQGMSAVSLALVYKGRAEVGAVYMHQHDELFTAARGEGAYLNGKPIHVLDAKSPEEVLVALGTMPYHKEYADQLFSLAKRLYLDCIDIRRSGAAAVDLCYLAAGRVGLFVERGLKVWDYAAGSLILEEAGGKLTDWQGRPVPMYGECDLAGSNTALHGYLLDLLSKTDF